MNAPRCKIGDRVIVIGPEGGVLLGHMGVVRSLWDEVSPIDGHTFIGAPVNPDSPCWIVELAADASLIDTSGDWFVVRRVPYPDVWLQPIRGDTLPQVQEEEQCLTAS